MKSPMERANAVDIPFVRRVLYEAEHWDIERSRKSVEECLRNPQIEGES